MWPAKQNIVFFEIFGFRELLDSNYTFTLKSTFDDGHAGVKRLS